MQRVLRRIRRSLNGIQEYLFFKFSPKKDDHIFFYPHPNGRVDGYDIINYYSDNVLCLINYIVEHKAYSHLFLYIIVFDRNKIEQYKNYLSEINPNQKVCFIDETNKQKVIRLAAKSKFLFTDTGHTYFRYKTNKQQLICLNYCVPFKNDFVNNRKLREERARINNIFDYFLMTAPLPARVAACDKGISLSKFLMLGFCRNDVFYQRPSNKVKNYISKEVGLPVSKYVVYTPTYRDYEASAGEITRDIFGYDGSEYAELERVLEEHNAVIIAKLHPKQINIKATNMETSRIVMYRDLGDNPFSLYQYLAEADGLITDYTSTYIDFLHRNKPVIFNFYDFDLYTETRGFGFEPIKTFCAGEIVENAMAFVGSVSRVFKNDDVYSEQRSKIAPVFDSYYDGNNTKRICEYFFDKE